jgi:hypothetical protein
MFMHQTRQAIIERNQLPVFQTNRLILEFAQQTTVVHHSHELQYLACTGPQGASGMGEALTQHHRNTQ